MALPKIEDARSLDDQALAEEILAVKQELFHLRLERATGRLEKPHLFKHKKHRLAQLLTVEGERARAQDTQETPAEESTTAEVSETQTTTEEE